MHLLKDQTIADNRVWDDILTDMFHVFSELFTCMQLKPAQMWLVYTLQTAKRPTSCPLLTDSAFICGYLFTEITLVQTPRRINCNTSMHFIEHHRHVNTFDPQSRGDTTQRTVIGQLGLQRRQTCEDLANPKTIQRRKSNMCSAIQRRYYQCKLW